MMTFGNPPRGAKAKLMAYAKHTERHRCNPLDGDALELAIADVAAQRGVLSLSDTPTDDELDFGSLYAFVCSAVLTVKGDRTPGYPLNLEFSTNSMALEEAYDPIVLAATARLHLWLTTPLSFVESVSKDDLGLVLTGFVDPSSVFIKDEPHPLRKLRDGRYRSISPVSLVDQLVESVLFAESARRLKDDIYENGSAVGIGFTDKQTKQFVDFVERKSKDLGFLPVGEDFSGFDAVHTVETLRATAEIDSRTHVDARGRPMEAWRRANVVWTLCCAHSVSIIDGTLWCKVVPGMLNSGSRDTSRRNTTLRVLYTAYLYRVIGKKMQAAFANGDDGIHWGLSSREEYEEFQRAASAAGFTLRDFTGGSESFSFCSHSYQMGSDRAPLESVPKMVYRMITLKSLTLDDALQAVNECRHNESYPLLREFVYSMDLPSHDESDEQLDIVYPQAYGQGGDELSPENQVKFDAFILYTELLEQFVITNMPREYAEWTGEPYPVEEELEEAPHEWIETPLALEYDTDPQSSDLDPDTESLLELTQEEWDIVQVIAEMRESDD